MLLPAPAPQFAHPKRHAALRIVLLTVPRVSRSGGHLLDEFDLHLVPSLGIGVVFLYSGVTLNVARPDMNNYATLGVMLY